MKKIIALLLLVFLFTIVVFSHTENDANITVEITNIEIGGGRIYLAIFSSAESLRNESPDYPFILMDNDTIAYRNLTLPAGEYVISAFQDTNNNGRLDRRLFGIPREPVGISNYFGRGYPSENFDRQKILINSSTGKVTIGLYRF